MSGGAVNKQNNVSARAGVNLHWFTQERIVLAISVVMFVAFSLTLNGFFSVDNLLILTRNVAVLGILGVGMAIVVIGRGIDLSIIAVMAVSAAFTLQLINDGYSIGVALAAGGATALTLGVINGLLIAFVEIPALFATLATGMVLYGFGKAFLVDLDVVYLPENTGWFEDIGKGTIGPLPMSIAIFAGVAFLVFLILSRTRFGRFVYATGDNPLAARVTGVGVRTLIVGQYALSSMIGFVAGIVVATSVSSMNTRIFNSTMVYDVILVVVLGGIGLSGGKGSVRSVIVGTLLIGTLLDGMTIMDVQYTLQSLVKSLILLFAIVLDSLLHPRNEETAQQGDI